MSKRKKHDEELKKEERDGRKHNRRMIGQTKGEEEKNKHRAEADKETKSFMGPYSIAPLVTWNSASLPHLLLFFNA